MTKSRVYFLRQDRFNDVPNLIRKAAGDFLKPDEFVAIKLHFGEKGNRGYIRPEWVKPVVNMVKGAKGVPFLTDTNTIYRGQRADAVNHLMLAQGHGFKIEKVGAPVIIADGLRGNEYVDVPVEGDHFKSVKIAKAIHDANSMIVLSHTKGHILTGFGGAVKNLGMGCASKGAKYEMHASVAPEIIEDKCVGCGQCIEWCSGEALSIAGGKIALDKDKCIGCGECIQACVTGALEIPWAVPSQNVQERLAEHAAGAVKDKKAVYVNYMHYISKHCDCFASDDAGPLLDNLGILVSTDPVAVDQASIDIINKAAGKDIFKEIHSKDWSVQLTHAEKMGLGSRGYESIK